MIFVIAAAIFVLLLLIGFLCGMTHIRFYKKTRKGAVSVACVGDSITYGCYIPFFFARNYPSLLQKALGSGYTVNNYGKNNRTLQPDGNHPYIRSGVCRQSLSRGADVVIIMLGTNDSKPCNWKDETAFRAAYEDLLRQYEEAYPGCRVILCTPPQVGRPTGFFALLSNACDNEKVKVISRVIRAVAADRKKEVADMSRLTEGCDDLFSFDHLHTNHQGAKAMAKLLSEIIRHPARTCE